MFSAPGIRHSSTYTAGLATRIPGDTMPGVMDRRAAQVAHTVTLLLANTAASLSAASIESGSRRRFAYSGRATMLASPASQSDTVVADAAAAMAAVNAVLQRGGSSNPAVALITRARFIA